MFYTVVFSCDPWVREHDWQAADWEPADRSEVYQQFSSLAGQDFTSLSVKPVNWSENAVSDFASNCDPGFEFILQFLKVSKHSVHLNFEVKKVSKTHRFNIIKNATTKNALITVDLPHRGTSYSMWTWSLCSKLWRVVIIFLWSGDSTWRSSHNCFIHQLKVDK